MTTKDSAPANGNASTSDANATADGIDTDTLREMAAAEQATGTTETGTAPMSATPEPAAVPQTTDVPPATDPAATNVAPPPVTVTDDGQRPGWDNDPPEHVPGTTNPRTTRKIAYVAIAAAVIAALLIFGRLLTGSAAGTEEAVMPGAPQQGAQPSPPAAASVVPKDTDATECTVMGVSTDTFRAGWCTGRAPGAYLLADDTMAYCSCAKPRKAAAGGK